MVTSLSRPSTPPTVSKRPRSLPHHRQVHHPPAIDADTTVTLTGKTEIITYTISYELDGGEVTGFIPYAFNVNTKSTALAEIEALEPTKTSYDFDKWVITYDDDGNMTCTAKWNDATVTLTVNFTRCRRQAPAHRQLRGPDRGCRNHDFPRQGCQVYCGRRQDLDLR